MPAVQELHSEVYHLPKKQAVTYAVKTLTPVFAAITRIEADKCDSTAFTLLR